jgi:hypothetical protein
MARPSHSKELTLFSKPPLLITESAEDFASLSAALAQEIKPRGIVEQIYVDDIAALVWEILRYRRCKAAIINTAFKAALEKLVNRLAGYTDSDTPEREEREALVENWFSEPEAKKEVSELLAEYHLDESVIEAEAIRSRSEELEVLDRMLTSLESRRNRALRCITDYQDRFARQVREVSDRLIEGKAVVQLENRSARRSA